MDERRDYRSLSQLTTYAGCSEAYRLKYIESVPQAPAAWLAQGTAFHNTVQRWEEMGRPIVNLVDGYQHYYDELIKEFKERTPDLKQWLKAPKTAIESDIQNRREVGHVLVDNYLKTFTRFGRPLFWYDDFTPGIEFEFEVELGGIKVRGAVDRIEREEDGSLHVYDLKTGNREAAKIQLGIYKVALQKVLGVKVSKASFFYAKDGKLQTLTDDDLDRYTESYVTELISALNRGIEHEVFIPNVTSSCFLCPVQKQCREFS